jgi:hypothetical protein
MYPDVGSPEGGISGSGAVRPAANLISKQDQMPSLQKRPQSRFAPDSQGTRREGRTA